MEELAGLDNELPIVSDAELGKAKVITGLGVTVEDALFAPPLLLPPPQATKDAHKRAAHQIGSALKGSIFTNIFTVCPREFSKTDFKPS
jgi:hypothetical protein